MKHWPILCLVGFWMVVAVFAGGCSHSGDTPKPPPSPTNSPAP